MRLLVEQSIETALWGTRPSGDCWAEDDVQDPFTKEWLKRECAIGNRSTSGLCARHRDELLVR